MILKLLPHSSWKTTYIFLLNFIFVRFALLPPFSLLCSESGLELNLSTFGFFRYKATEINYYIDDCVVFVLLHSAPALYRPTTVLMKPTESSESVTSLMSETTGKMLTSTDNLASVSNVQSNNFRWWKHCWFFFYHSHNWPLVFSFTKYLTWKVA